MADWGDTNTYSTSWNFGSLFVYFGGTSPSGSNQLDFVTINAGGADTYRVGVYSGGSLDDPSGATLLEDMGTVSSSGDNDVVTITSSTNPTLPDAGRVWIALKSSGFAGPNRTTSGTAGSNDYDSIVVPDSSGDNSNAAWPSTVPSDTFSTATDTDPDTGNSASIYLTYSASGGGGSTILPLLNAYYG